MNQFLASVPKNILAFVAIAAGIVFIILSQPPASVCDQQIEVIKTAQTNFLYKDEFFPKSKVIKTTKYEYLRDRCKQTNDPGGCYELFQEMKILLHDLNTLTSACASAAGSLAPVRRALWETLDLMVRLAWGEKPPESYSTKLGWLDSADVNLYCKLKDKAQLIFGESQWDRFREKLMVELPGAKELPRNQVWDLSLFSENCARYP